MPTIETTFAVKGMSCGGCVNSVRRVIGSVPGAEPVEVEIGRARVRIDPSQASASQVADALSRAGYEAAEQG